MLDAQALMQRHIEALYTQDAAGQLLRVREHNGGPAPRVFVGRTAVTTECRFRADVPENMRSELIAALAPGADGELPDNPPTGLEAERARLAAILARSGSVTGTAAGPAFAFPENLLRHTPRLGVVVRISDANVELLEPLLPEWIPDVHLSPPLYAVVVNNQAVAVCGSVRITARAHEAGLETATSFRGLGYAAPVVSAWALAVRELGAEPLYSTSWENTASRAVARKLGLVHFGNDLHLT